MEKISSILNHNIWNYRKESIKDIRDKYSERVDVNHIVAKPSSLRKTYLGKGWVES